jgi:hypothetical protein
MYIPRPTDADKERFKSLVFEDARVGSSRCSATWALS